ncbi:hypothetical protein CAP35_04515 [Chitinophagaceae bacterium IBVUCB1]|nr:hypothetical protein CAP35_04515 [Chitinophagaceae bacterium IBVUCB1]
MKKYFAILFAMIMAECVYGQGFQVGLRSGAGINYHNYDFQERKDLSWNNQATIRYEVKKWAFEMGIEHDYMHMDRVPTYHKYDMYFETLLFAPASEIEIRRNTQINWVGLNIGAQYDVMCGLLKSKCSILKNFSNYVGLQISPSRAIYTEDSKYQSVSDNSISERRYRYSIWDVSFGLNNTMKYSISTRIDIVSHFSLRLSPWGFDQSNVNTNRLYSTNTSINNTIGIYYKL